MVKKDLTPILKGSGEKPTIDCLHCFAQISHRNSGRAAWCHEHRLNTISTRITTGLHDTSARNARKR
ncbi:MAG: hypothetical protein KKA10_15960 [Euryarchaeota archaeon]|nr:hypothetical protein [Euryarchaeota archaeon]MCG2737189.1 hypothetical protein [Candidatus Methanoperedenaceae archaeon]